MDIENLENTIPDQTILSTYPPPPLPLVGDPKCSKDFVQHAPVPKGNASR